MDSRLLITIVIGGICLAAYPTVIVPIKSAYIKDEGASAGFEKKGMWKNIEARKGE